jgi:hypothetical protein
MVRSFKLVFATALFLVAAQVVTAQTKDGPVSVPREADSFITAMPDSIAASPSSRAIANYLASHCSSSERARACAAFQYVTSYFHPLPQEGITQTDCLGHSLLFKAICTAMGLQAEVVGGHERKAEGGAPAECSHSWNAVKINGAWGLVEPTWDPSRYERGQAVRKPNFYNFLTPPKEFLSKHVPDETKWQLLEKPLQQSEIDELPYASSPFYSSGLKAMGKAANSTVAGESTAKLTFENPAHVPMVAELWEGKQKLSNRLTFSQTEGETAGVWIVFPHAGRYTLKILSKSVLQPDHWDEAIAYSLMANGGVGQDAGLPETFELFMKSGASLNLPSAYYLKGGDTLFSIRIPGALRAGIMYGDQLIPLFKTGDSFKRTVYVAPGAGTVTLTAVFPDKKDFNAAIVAFMAR